MKKIAVGQMHSETLNLNANIEKMQQFSAKAAKAGAQIILFPELCMTGYRADEQFSVLAQPLNGEAVQMLTAMSQKNNGILIYTSIPEWQGGDKKPFNTAVLVGENGLISSYRKVHLWGAETEYFQAGNGFCTQQTPLGTAGMLVCFDVSYPESARQCALAGADLLMYVFAFANYERKYAFELLTRTRALENGCYVAAANLIGKEKDTEFFGGSCVIDPAGRVLASVGDEEGIAVADFDPALLQTVRHTYPYLERRRADLY